MPTGPLLLAKLTRTITCSLCGGTGEACTSSGTFDMQQAHPYPDEHSHTCPECNGDGKVEAGSCLVYAANVEVCSCTDEEIDTHLLTSYLGAA